MNTTLRMKIIVPSASGAVTAEETPVDRPVRGGSTDPKEFLAMRARQREAQRRMRRWKFGIMTLTCLGTIGLAFAMPRWRQQALVLPEPETSVAAAAPAATTPEPARVVAPVPAVTTAPAEPPAPAAPTAQPASAAVTPEAAAASASTCDDDFARRQWRAAIASCGAAFEAAPNAALAMKLAHSHWSHGDTAKAGSWAERAVSLETDDADAFVLIGHAERKAGHPAAALTAYRNYLRLAPSGWHAARVRAAVRELKAVQQTESEPVSASN
jgi:hypothetical protein